jgi:hypothetical protein
MKRNVEHDGTQEPHYPSLVDEMAPHSAHNSTLRHVFE